MSPRTLDLDLRVEPGGAIFQRRFTRFVSDLTDLSDLYGDLADDLERIVEEGFATEGTSHGGKWAPLSTAYGEQKARQYPGKGILERTGTMRRGFGGGGPGGIRRITQRQLVWGTAVPYAQYHQGGTRRMPARPVIRLTTENKSDWTRLVHRYLLERARGLSGGRP